MYNSKARQDQRRPLFTDKKMVSLGGKKALLKDAWLCGRRESTSKVLYISQTVYCTPPSLPSSLTGFPDVPQYIKHVLLPGEPQD